MEFVATNDDGSRIRFVDDKRWLWFGALALPAVPLTAFWFYFISGDNPLFLTFPALYFFFLVPVLDAIVGGDSSNPPEAVVPEMTSAPLSATGP